MQEPSAEMLSSRSTGWAWHPSKTPSTIRHSHSTNHQNVHKERSTQSKDDQCRGLRQYQQRRRQREQSVSSQPNPSTSVPQKPEEESFARKEQLPCHTRSKHFATQQSPSVEENSSFGATEIRHMEPPTAVPQRQEPSPTVPNDFGPNFSTITIPDQNTNAGAHPGKECAWRCGGCGGT